jgi:hypothetical protein
VEIGESGGARMHSEAARVQRMVDQAGSVRFDGSQNPRKPTLIQRLRRWLERRRS